MKFIVDTDAHSVAPLDGESAPASWFDDAGFNLISDWWLQSSWQRKYSYQFEWLGRPIIQLPNDVMMMQDLIWRIRPTLIVETGIAHGGSVVLHASLLALLHGVATTRPRVIAVDVEIRPHNRQALEDHPLHDHWKLIEGSSISPHTFEEVCRAIRADDRVLVVLDSNHTRDHVAAELELYAPLVSQGSAIVVMDTIMPQLADLPSGNHSWRTDNPAQAVEAFLATDLGSEFVLDRRYEHLKPTHSPGGVLLRNSSSKDRG